jgi:hypothetical protein
VPTGLTPFPGDEPDVPPAGGGKSPEKPTTGKDEGDEPPFPPKEKEPKVPAGKKVLKKKAKRDMKLWTKEAKQAAWKKYDCIATSYEPEYKKVVEKYLAKVEALTIDLVEKHAVKVKSNICAMGLQKRKQWLGENKAKLDQMVPDFGSLRKELMDGLKPAYLKELTEVGQARIAEFTKHMNQKAKPGAEFKIKFDPKTPFVKKWLGTRLEETSKTITNTDLDKVQRSIRDDFENGESQTVMADHIRSIFDPEESYRADLIARTESSAAYNRGDLEGIRQMGLGDRVGKVWVAEEDDRTRATHMLAADRYSDGYDKETGDPMLIDDEFEVGDDFMVAPANGEEAEENCNCRCGMVYEILTEGEEE